MIDKNKDKDKNRKIILLGSGALKIGQAGEFDYSGTQALRALEELGHEVIVVNPNIATVQTDPDPKRKVYLYPVLAEWVEKIIQIEKPVGIVAGFGGQTALSCLMDLEEKGILKKYNVQNFGTDSSDIIISEDRKLFVELMNSLGIPTSPSKTVTTLNEARKVVESMGYPIMVRSAFALGGLGSGVITKESEIEPIIGVALGNSPQVILERYLKGWKEIEYELMRDQKGNAITICNMENLNPLGIHTGDSIVVTPSQTLTDKEYQILRDISFKIAKSLNVIGECNVQFALDPQSRDFFVIEINCRLSRSSALASKASGYPIAYIAAKVVVGNSLSDLQNPVTQTTSAFYEPSLDYVTLKVPKWDFAKFPNASRSINSTMKSVGEIMAIGRNFQECFQKAIRSVTENSLGISLPMFTNLTQAELNQKLEIPADDFIFALYEALRRNMALEEIYKITAVDQWFLSEINEILQLEVNLNKKFNDYKEIEPVYFRELKCNGFSDAQIAWILDSKVTDLDKKSLEVRAYRKSLGITPFIKKIDTTSAEYPTPSNYLFMTYDAGFSDVDKEMEGPKALILGSGAYRIGSSVEFDWCSVSCSNFFRKSGHKTIVVNCNPETVSTDYNSSDRLYFEEITSERVLDIYDFEKPQGTVVSMGGQVPNCLASILNFYGVNIYGHSIETIENAEDRHKFSDILDRIGIKQPPWAIVSDVKGIEAFVETHGFPILVRPSFVLSGTAMNVANDMNSLNDFLKNAIDISEKYPVVMSKFINSAIEIEMDGIAQDGELILSIVAEHIEYAGVHSGDSTISLPPQTINSKIISEVKSAGKKIAKELNLNGPFNIQFLKDGDDIAVIECNARASRSFPFSSKISRHNMAKLATQVFIGKKLSPLNFDESKLEHVGVKAPMFSFTRLQGVDPILSVEMSSTGEVGCISKTFAEALLLSYQSTDIDLPKKGLLISSGDLQNKQKCLDIMPIIEELNIPIYSTRGTYDFLIENGYKNINLSPWPNESKKDVIYQLKEDIIDFVINIPKNFEKEELINDAIIRRTAVSYGAVVFTNMESAKAFFQSIKIKNKKNIDQLYPLPSFLEDLS
jgi:carbamoyl-phosphate synthase large subunit